MFVQFLVGLVIMSSDDESLDLELPQSDSDDVSATEKRSGPLTRTEKSAGKEEEDDIVKETQEEASGGDSDDESDESDDEDDSDDDDSDDDDSEGEEEEEEEVGERAGVLQELRLVNFMNHTNFRLPLHPQVNFVVGLNGSGKSAILAALRVALGASAKVMLLIHTFTKLGEDCNPLCLCLLFGFVFLCACVCVSVL